MKSSLEAKVGAKMPERHPLLAWMVQGAAEVITRYQVGADGKTAYQRWRGRTGEKKVAIFGEKVMWRPPRCCGKRKKAR